MIDTGVKLSIVRNLRAPRRDRRAASLHGERRRAARADPDAVLLANGPGDPAALDYIVDTVRELVGKRPCLRDLPRPPAALPRRRPRDLQAAVRPPRRQPPGQGPDDRARRDHQPEPRLRGARPRGARTIDGDEPVRWETDFGAAELTHINLYDRTVEGLGCATSRARRSSTTPRPGPARTTRCDLFDQLRPRSMIERRSRGA